MKPAVPLKLRKNIPSLSGLKQALCFYAALRKESTCIRFRSSDSEGISHWKDSLLSRTKTTTLCELHFPTVFITVVFVIFKFEMILARHSAKVKCFFYFFSVLCIDRIIFFKSVCSEDLPRTDTETTDDCFSFLCTKFGIGINGSHQYRCILIICCLFGG